MIAFICIAQGNSLQVAHSTFQAKEALLKSKYAALNETIQNLSFAKFKGWMAANATGDFTIRSADGTLAASAATLTMMRNEFLVLKAVKASTFKMSNLSIHADHISCTIKTHLDARTKDGSHLVEDSLAVDTWHPDHSTWKLATIVTTKDKFTLNGKVVRSAGLTAGEAFP